MNAIRDLPMPWRLIAFLMLAIGFPIIVIGGSVLLYVLLAPLVNYYYVAFILFTPVMLLIALGLWGWERLRRLRVRPRPRD